MSGSSLQRIATRAPGSRAFTGRHGAYRRTYVLHHRLMGELRQAGLCNAAYDRPARHPAQSSRGPRRRARCHRSGVGQNGGKAAGVDGGEEEDALQGRESGAQEALITRGCGWCGTTPLRSKLGYHVIRSVSALTRSSLILAVLFSLSIGTSTMPLCFIRLAANAAG